MSISEMNRLIDSGDLESARQICGPLLDDMTIPEEARARSAFRLSVAYRNSGNLAAADELYRVMERLGSSEEVLATRARTAFNLFESYRKAGMLKEAGDIYASMNRLQQNDEIRLFRAMAAVNLVQSYAEQGEDAQALAVFEAMGDIGATDEINTIRAAAAVFLLEAYERKGDYPQARKAFESLNALGVGESEDVSVACASSCPVMTRICIKAGKIEEAKGIYHLVSSLVDKFPYLWERKDEVFSIIYEATGESDFLMMPPG
jgi:tetratricopeptide (TPR) repeat protein